MSTFRKYLDFTLHVAIFSFFVYLFFLRNSSVWGFSIPEVFRLISAKMYVPSHNVFSNVYIAGVCIQFLFYGIVILSSLIMLLLPKLIFRKSGEGFRTYLVRSSVLACAGAIVLQSYGQFNFSSLLYKEFGHGTQEEQHLRIFKKAYRFVTFCQQNLPSGTHYKAKFVSDLDPKGTIEPYEIAYFLYPQVSLFINDGKEENCVLVFNKTNARDSVPPGFFVLAVLDEKNLIALKN